MRVYSVVIDANVLFSPTLRDAMMRLAMTDLFKARWTDKIHQEWVDAVVTKQGVDRIKAEAVRDLMDLHALDAKIDGYEELIPSLSLPDPDDRHVLAAAIRANADAIVTFNLKDFPEAALTPYDIEVIHPDDFIVYQIEFSPEKTCEAFKRLRKTKHRPPLSVEDMLNILRRCGLPQTALMLERYQNII